MVGIGGDTFCSRARGSCVMVLLLDVPHETLMEESAPREDCLCNKVID